MNDTIETLLHHVSVRDLTAEPLTTALIHQLVTVAQHAPTASFQQSYTIIGVTDPTLRQKIAALAGGQRFVATGGTLFVFCADLRRIQQVASQQGTDLTPTLAGIDATLAGTVDATLAAQNMAVAAESLGLGTCYSGGIRDGITGIASLLALPAGVCPILGLVVGHPRTRNAPKPRLPLAAVYHENQYAEAPQAVADYDMATNRYYAQRLGHPTTRCWSQTARDSFQQHPRAFVGPFLHAHGLARH